MEEGGCDPLGGPRWSRVLLETCSPWRGKPTLEQVFPGRTCGPCGGPTPVQLIREGLTPWRNDPRDSSLGSGGMRRWRGAGLAALAAVLLGARGWDRGGRGWGPSRLPSPLATSRTSVPRSSCSPSLSLDLTPPHFIHTFLSPWYRQLPGREPALLVSSQKGVREMPGHPGWLSVSPDRRWSTLWLSRPRVGDAVVYYCALADTARGAGAAAGHEPPRAGPGAQRRPGTAGLCHMLQIPPELRFSDTLVFGAFRGFSQKYTTQLIVSTAEQSSVPLKTGCSTPT
ncbi:uncharacterized protein LOC135402778 [Pseudopipra pipra]|uniref:uncharacterized protein LOC135402778 n=1 Tax=Pseudopipra pipra TaxID=415032 RepID=UPI0031389713